MYWLAWASVSCGRLAFTPAPGPVLWYSKKRASFQEKPLMSVHGCAVLIAAGRAVSR